MISFGIDQAALYRLAASYVDRILKDEKPADLPEQAPTKYETVLNIKTAKTLGLEVPAKLLARADEVIERVKAPGKAGAISRCKILCRRSGRGGTSAVPKPPPAA